MVCKAPTLVLSPTTTIRILPASCRIRINHNDNVTTDNRVQS